MQRECDNNQTEKVRRLAEEKRRSLLRDQDIAYLHTQMEVIFKGLEKPSLSIDELVELSDFRTREVAKTFGFPFNITKNNFVKKMCLIHMALTFNNQFHLDLKKKSISLVHADEHNGASEEQPSPDADMSIANPVGRIQRPPSSSAQPPARPPISTTNNGFSRDHPTAPSPTTFTSKFNLMGINDRQRRF